MAIVPNVSHNIATKERGFRFRLVHVLFAVGLLAAAFAAFGPLSAPLYSPRDYDLEATVTYGSRGLVPGLVVLGSWMYVWSRKSRPVALAKLVGLALILYLLLISFIPTRVASRGAANRTECNNHLKQIGLALQSYHDTCGTFPPAYVSDDHGRRMHSWRVLILPYLGHVSLYRRYSFAEPWDGPTNALLVNEMPDEYRCPSHYVRSSSAAKTSYLAVIGPQTMWPDANSRRLDEVTDGPEGTLMLVEGVSREVNWLEPRDMHFSEAVALLASKPRTRTHVAHPAGINALHSDGHTEFHLYGRPTRYWEAMFTINGRDAPPDNMSYDALHEPRWRRLTKHIPNAVFVLFAFFPLPWVWMGGRKDKTKPESDRLSRDVSG